MPKNLGVRMTLHVNSENRPLDADGPEQTRRGRNCLANYSVMETNVPMDESLFMMDESRAEYKVIDITDTLLTSLIPDAAESPAIHKKLVIGGGDMHREVKC